MSERRFGWIKDKWDDRDYLYRVVPPRVIPESVDLSQFMPEIRDQGNEGACVGFGVAINFSASAKQQGVYQEWHGPRWFYNGARELEHRLDQEGCYPRDAFDFALKYGCLLEHFWPYKPKVEYYLKASTHPNAPHAKDWPIIEYIRVIDARDGVCQALADGHLVSFGTPWYSEWMNPKDGVLPTPQNLVGGHEVCICGYDLKTQRFKFANSWSAEWGVQGYGYLPFAHFERIKADGGYDAHVVRVTWGSGDGPEDFPVDKIESVQCFDRLEGMDTWRELGPPNEIPDGQLPIYRSRTTINTSGDFEAFARTRLKATSRFGRFLRLFGIKTGEVFDGPIRKFKVINVTPPPPPPPPPEDEPSAVIEIPKEGAELEAGKETIWEIHVYKKK